MKSNLRNIFHINDEDKQWKAVLNQFPNKVPRFQSKDDALNFTKLHCERGSNPDYVNLQHSVSTLIDWDQINKYLLPKIKEYYSKWNVKHGDSIKIQHNRFLQSVKDTDKSDNNHETIYSYLQSRLNLSIHRTMAFESTMNTLKYMFFHMKCGIFVMIRNNEVVIFCPFVNKDYRNSWNGALQIQSFDGGMASYYAEKSDYSRKENYLPDMSQWWANGNIICNEYKSDNDSNQYWGDHFLLQLKDMFAECCSQREVPDCEFFVNKRDYPHLKFNKDVAGGIPVEPYGFIFDRDDRDPSQDVPLPPEQQFKSFAPILSFYSSERFADIPIPPTEDWESATGEVFPASFVHSRNSNGEPSLQPPRDLFTAGNLKKFEKTWDEKVNTAFFRGTATGGGVTTATNQRLHLAQTCYDWSSRKELNGSTTGGVPFLDAKITGWNLRDKKISSEKMTHLRPPDFPFEGDRVKNFVEIYKQATYKYLIYAEGHCAACRYGFMMLLGSVILKVESKCVADQMWYFPLLRPFVDHVPVKADLSDLLERLQWCHSHDEECRQIAANAKALYHRYVSRDGILDYLQVICAGISQRWHYPPVWAREPTSIVSAETRPAPPTLPASMIGDPNSRFCVEDHENDITALCAYCEASKRLELSRGRQRQMQEYNARSAGAAVDASLSHQPRVVITTEDEKRALRKLELKERKKQLAEEERAAKRAKTTVQ